MTLPIYPVVHTVTIHKMSELLKISKGNAKLRNKFIFSLPAGYTCPNAGVCKTFAGKAGGGIMDLSVPGEVPSFRCFAASQEAQYTNVRKARWHNYELLRAVSMDLPHEEAAEQMANLIEVSFAHYFNHRNYNNYDVRIHESGDFFNESYFMAWMKVAERNPMRRFYAYTKSLDIWLRYSESLPSNLYLTASFGGHLDSMILRYPHVFTRYSRVVYTPAEAMALGLSIDHDDSHCFGESPFALLVHGTQAKGSDASKAIVERRKKGQFSGYAKA